MSFAPFLNEETFYSAKVFGKDADRFFHKTTTMSCIYAGPEENEQWRLFAMIRFMIAS